MNRHLSQTALVQAVARARSCPSAGYSADHTERDDSIGFCDDLHLSRVALCANLFGDPLRLGVRSYRHDELMRDVGPHFHDAAPEQFGYRVRR
jgi:hypothetical protein